MSSTSVDVTVNPSPLTANAVMTGSQLNNRALAAERAGDLSKAEDLHLQAIAIKERGLGLDHITTALSYNALGELYLKQKNVDDAEKYFDKAVAIRNRKGPAFDAAVSRENLAQLHELRGNLSKAKEIRMQGAPDKLACGNYQCTGQLFTLSELKLCSRCKNLQSVYYCSSVCQTNDWKKRHKHLCKTV